MSDSENQVVVGTSYSDTIVTSGGNDTINSGGGNDCIDSGAGNDVINAGAGIDYVDAGAGDDTIDAGSGDDTVFAGDGDDFVQGGAGHDFVDGGAGDDTIEGGGGDDALNGGDGADHIVGNAGSDSLYGGLGDDSLDTGDGADWAFGGGGNDYIVAGSGTGNDWLVGDGFDSEDDWRAGVTTSEVGDDYIVGGAGADVIYGDNGDASTALVGGNDVLIGGAGNDDLYGEGGNDVLEGGVGKDYLTGGAGADRFVFHADLVSSDSTSSKYDVITDFEQGQDKIDLTSLLGAANLAWGGTTPTALGVWYSHSGGNTFVYADVGGTSAAELRIQLCGIYTLTENDFLGLAGSVEAPFATNDAGAVGEDATLLASGNVLANDAGADLVVTSVEFGSTSGTVGSALAGAFGSLVLNADGTYTYSLDNDAANVQALAAGQVVQDVFTYTVTNDGGSSVATLTITIEGANDGPTIAATATASIDEDTTAAGTAAGADVDAGAVLTYSATQGANGSVAIDEDTGAWTYTPTANFNGTDTFTITVTDDQGAAATQTVTVNVAAVADAAEIGGDTAGSVTEDGTLEATGTLTVSDPDAGEAAFQPQAGTAGDYGSFSIDATGSWSYALANGSAAVQSLGAGEQVSDQFTVTTVDGTQQVVTITITGANDAPDAGNDTLTGIVEAGGVDNGEAGAPQGGPLDVLANDSDVDGDQLTVARARHASDGALTSVGATPTAIAGLYGTLFIQADGTTSYVLDNDAASTQALAENEAATDTFVYEVADGNATDTATISVAITGNNDAPTSVALSSSTVGRNLADIAVGTLSAQDVDSNSHTFTILPGGNGNQFVIDGNLLKVGASGGISAPAGSVLQVTVRATDAFGGFVDRTFAITVEDLPQFVLTSGTDGITLPDAGGYVIGTATTLNAGDSLVGGAGEDSLLLYGPGTFDLRLLSQFTDFEEIQLINFTTSQTLITLPSNLDITLTSSGNSKTFNLGSNSNVAITFSGSGNLFAMGSGGTTTITATGSSNTYRLGSGTEIINGSNSGTDTFLVAEDDAFTAGDSLDGRGGTDTLRFSLGSAATFDLRGLDQRNIEILDLANGTLLVDQQSLANVLSITGQASASLVTAEATLDLTGRSISNVRVQSSNATGTVFTVSSQAAAFQIAGGLGQDTLNAPNVTFSAAQRDQIFLSTSIETIVDTTGTYTSPFAGAFLQHLTTGTDSVTMPAAGGYVIAAPNTLTPNDSLAGGAGNDVLVLDAQGTTTFNLNVLSSFSDFDEIRLLNQSGSSTLTLRNGTNSEVNAIGNGSNAFQLGTGGETINGGNGADTFWVSAAGAFTAADFLNGGSGTDTLVLTLALGTTFDLRGLGYEGIETINYSVANGTLLIDQASLAGVNTIGGSAGASVVTAEETLDLRGRTVGLSVRSNNPGGTTFDVDTLTTLFSVAGGPGSDTVNAPTLNLTAAQREQVLMAGSIETLIDANGVHTPPYTGANVLRLTADVESVTLPDGGGSIVATATTLNAGDSLTGSDDADVLRLYGGGTYRIDQLSSFTGIEEIRLVNFAQGSSNVFLPTGLQADVVSIGNSQTFQFGSNSTVTISVDGNINLFVMGSGSTTTITASSASTGNTYRLGSGTEIIVGGGGSDSFQVLAADALTAADALDGGAGLDTILLSGTIGTVYDIRGFELQNIERISLSVGNGSLLIDQQSLASVTQVFGQPTAALVTAEATLDLTGRSVQDVRVESTNADGTVFTTNVQSVAFQIAGGPGEDTLQLQGVFTAEQRDFIFATSSVEIIRDNSGVYGNNAGNTLVGTSAGQTIVGGTGDDVLIGGLGADVLTGGLGGDEFVFQSPADGADTILDFGAGDDLLVIDAAAFGGGLVAGTPLSGAQLVANSSPAATASQGQFLYDTDSGALWWDPDGTGAEDPLLLATLTGAPTLTTADFELV